jgi:hypothetical protein
VNLHTASAGPAGIIPLGPTTSTTTLLGRAHSGRPHGVGGGGYAVRENPLRLRAGCW